MIAEAMLSLMRKARVQARYQAQSFCERYLVDDDLHQFDDAPTEWLIREFERAIENKDLRHVRLYSRVIQEREIRE